MPRTIGGKSGFVRSGRRTPTVNERFVFSPRAIGFGRYPTSWATPLTRSAVSSLTSPRVSAFSARETVPGCTCAARATSRSVTEVERTAPLCTRLQPASNGASVAAVPNISYSPVERLEDPELRGYPEPAPRHGTPRPESQAIRAHVPAVLRSFSRNWQGVFRDGVLEHRIKELCRVYVSQTIDCHY